MSKVSIQGDASGTGTLTIAAPNTNSNYTLTLPEETGTVLTSGGAIDVDASAPADSVVIDSSGNLKFNSGYGSAATAYGCRAWVNFNGTGTVAIREDGNVSSITDNGTGDYTVNFTTALPDANYGNNVTGVNDGTNDVVRVTITTAPTASALRFVLSNTVGNAQDSNRVSVAIFR